LAIYPLFSDSKKCFDMILFFFIEVLDYYPQSSISRIHREPELVGAHLKPVKGNNRHKYRPPKFRIRMCETGLIDGLGAIFQKRGIGRLMGVGRGESIMLNLNLPLRFRRGAIRIEMGPSFASVTETILWGEFSYKAYSFMRV
jgi:hypothetical protein